MDASDQKYHRKIQRSGRNSEQWAVTRLFVGFAVVVVVVAVVVISRSFCMARPRTSEF